MAQDIQTILDNAKNLVIKVTGSGAGTTTIVDASALNPSCTRLNLLRAAGNFGASTSGTLLWDATTDVTIITLNEFSNHDAWDFCYFGGIPNNGGAGVTGDVNLTITGTGVYTLVLTFSKQDPVREA